MIILHRKKKETYFKDRVFELKHSVVHKGEKKDYDQDIYIYRNSGTLKSSYDRIWNRNYGLMTLRTFTVTK